MFCKFGQQMISHQDVQLCVLLPLTPENHPNIQKNTIISSSVTFTIFYFVYENLYQVIVYDK